MASPSEAAGEKKRGLKRQKKHFGKARENAMPPMKREKKRVKLLAGGERGKVEFSRRPKGEVSPFDLRGGGHAHVGAWGRNATEKYNSQARRERPIEGDQKKKGSPLPQAAMVGLKGSKRGSSV